RISGVKLKGSQAAEETVDIDYDLRGVDAFAIRDSIAVRLPPKLRETARSSGSELLNRPQLNSPAWFPHPDLSVVSAVAGSFANQLRTYAVGKENTADRLQLLFRFVAPPDAD